MVRVPFTVRHLCLPCSTTGVPLSDIFEALLRCCQETARTSSTIHIYGYKYIFRSNSRGLATRHDKLINLATLGPSPSLREE